MKTRRIDEVGKGDRLATEDPEVDAHVTHSYANTKGIKATPFRGGEQEDAWIIVWRNQGGDKAGRQEAQFCAPSDIVRVIL